VKKHNFQDQLISWIFFIHKNFCIISYFLSSILPCYSAYFAFYTFRVSHFPHSCYTRLCLTPFMWIMLRRDIWLSVARICLEKEACSCAGQFPGGLESSAVRVQIAPTDKYLSRESSGTKEHSLWPYASW